MSLEWVLIVDDDSMLRGVLSDLLKQMGYSVLAVTGAPQARQAMKEQEFDLILSDLKLEEEDGITFLKSVREKFPHLPLMIITGHRSFDTAVEGIQLGVFDYLTKPIDYARLEWSMKRLENILALEAENIYLRQELADAGSGGDIYWGESEAMKEVERLIERISRADTTVLIEGESGTGKEVVAHALHQRGRRADRPFISVNCAAIPSNLLESEFFGHEKGAFTGAVQRRAGRFELANEGTLLLDEISEIPPDLQVKLLRVLQEREFERVGGSKTYQVDINLIATTNRNLDREVAEGRFREDLYYRLNVVPIKLPGLRERGEDVIQLAEFFIDRFARKHGRKIQPMGADILHHLRAYSWPGNVRELQNAIERAVILADDGGELQLEDFPSLYGKRGPERGDALTTIDRMEHEMIGKALKQFNGNRTHAARALDISLRTLRNKIKRYNDEGRPVES
jgi:DNA-binding NtrC family response regulator